MKVIEMKKLNIFFAAILIVAFMALTAIPSLADEDPVSKAADAVLNYFVPISGTVEGAVGETVKVRLEVEGDVPSSVRLTVFKKGEPFYHPVTNEKIGNTEFSAGRIEINEKVSGSLYTAAVKSGNANAGDSVRLVSSRIKIASLQ